MSASQKIKIVFRSLDRDSDEFLDLFGGLVPILEEHFASVKDFNAKHGAHRLISCYEGVMEDFWTREQATAALTRLKQAVINIGETYDDVQSLVLYELTANASQADEQIQSDFLNETVLDIIPTSHLPGPEAEEAVAALRTLCNYRDALVSTIEKTQRELPNGVKTRNRPLKEWAIIDACADLVRAYDAMNVPKAMERSGDFYRFLRDIFRVFGLHREDFSGVYRGWIDLMDTNFDNKDLLPI